MFFCTLNISDHDLDDLRSYIFQIDDTKPFTLKLLEIPRP